MKSNFNDWMQSISQIYHLYGFEYIKRILKIENLIN